MSRTRIRNYAPTRIGSALGREVTHRGTSREEAGKELGITGPALTDYIGGRRLPALDPRRLAAFLHHEDGREWTVEEVLDVLERDRAARRAGGAAD